MNTISSKPSGTVLLVLGMHRSGTSAITRVLNLLGVPLGRDLLQAQEDNSKGFWEHTQAVAINEKLLAALDRHWHDVREMPEGWMEHPAALQARGEIAALIRAELGSAGAWAVKDPRMCRLAPLWLSVIEQEGVQARAILMVRDPREVALSLQKRDGWTPAHSYLMWAQHLVEAYEATANIPRSLATYDGLLADWRGTMQRVGSQLGMAWPTSEAQAGAGIDAFITPGDRHHNVAGERLPEPLEGTLLPDLLRALNAAASSIAAGQADWSALQGLREDYRAAASIYMQPVSELVAERNELERLALERMDHINGLVIAKQFVEEREAKANAEVAQLHGTLQASKAEMEALALDRRELVTLREATAHEREYVERAFRMSDRMESELRAQVRSLESRLLHEQELHGAAYSRLAEAGGHLEAKMLDRQAETERLHAQVERRVAEMALLERQLVEKDARMLELSNALASQVEHSALDLAAAEQRIQALAAEKDALAQEGERLAQQVQSLENRLSRANSEASRFRWLLGRAWRRALGLRLGDTL